MIDAKTLDIANLATAVKDAHQLAASLALLNPEDGGTCNMDCVILRFTRKPSPKKLVALDAALDGYWSKYMGGYCINPKVGGQAARRTRACHSIASELTSAGFTASVFYVTD